jgi:hypothetical protein
LILGYFSNWVFVFVVCGFLKSQKGRNFGFEEEEEEDELE